MKKNIELTINQAVKQTVEVELPFYRTHDLGGDDYDSMTYMRFSEDPNGRLIMHSVSKSEYYKTGQFRYEITVDKKADWSYWQESVRVRKSSLEEFLNALSEAESQTINMKKILAVQGA